MERTKKSLRNVAFGIAVQILGTAIAFLLKGVMVARLGIDAVSINGLYLEVVAAMSLAEMGIGSAVTYNLYKPIAENDTEKICQLLYFNKTIYRLIAAITFLIGSVACLFIPLLIHDIDYPVWYERAVFMLFVVNVSVSYLFTYKVSLLNADQSSYIVSIVNFVFKILGALGSLLILVFTRNFVLYLLCGILITIATNVTISLIVDRRYEYLRKEKLPKAEQKSIFNDVKNIFVMQLSGVVTNSTDNVLISVLVSTVLVGYYSFYVSVLGIFKQITEQVDSGIRASLGNLYSTGTNEECERILKRLTWIYSSFAIVAGAGVYAGMEAFIELWVGKEFLLSRSVLFILCVNLFFYISCKPIYAVMHVAGYFVQGRNISICGSVVNLIVSIILGRYWGIAGIFLGTVCTYVIQIVLKIICMYRNRFHKSAKGYWLMWAKALAIFFVSLVVVEILLNRITGEAFLRFLVLGALSVVISGVFVCVPNLFTDEFKYAIGFLKRVRLKK